MKSLAVVVGSIALTGGLCGAAPAAAPAARPDVLRKLVDCRAIQDATARLACYDAQVGALDVAEQRRDVVVMERKQVVEARKSLFGFSLPSLSLFGGGDKAEKDGDSISQIETTIARARQTGYGQWSFTLADGARWVQTDSKTLAVPPAPGQKIRIRKGAMTSYFANIEGQPGIRVRREN